MCVRRPSSFANFSSVACSAYPHLSPSAMAFLSAGQVPRLQPECLSQRVSLRSPAHHPLCTRRSRACAGPPDTSNSCSRVLPYPQPCFSPGLSSHSFSRPVLPAWRDVRQSCSASASSSSSSTFPQDPDFFDRKEEAEVLFALLGSTPSRVSVVVGPRSSGKTALLKRVAARHYRTTLRACPKGTPPGWLDGRKAELGSPRDMAAALHGMVGEEGSIFEGIKQASVGDNITHTGGVNLGFTRMDPKVVEVTAVKSAVQSAEDFFNQYKQQKKPEDPFPMLVVDEANFMQDWQPESERKMILAFFVNVAKVDCTARIILSTSDYSFLSWISEGLSSNNMKIMVLGDFPEEEAKEFFTTKVLPPDAPVDDNEWDRIYQVCGGNAGLLVNTGSDFAASKDWEISLESVVQPILMDVDAALQGKDLGNGMQYSSQQFKRVARMLLDAPPHAVPWNDMAAAVGSLASGSSAGGDAIERGKPPLLAMVKANALAYRPKSNLSRDLPPGSLERWPVGTALTAGHLHAMRILRDEGRL